MPSSYTHLICVMESSRNANGYRAEVKVRMETREEVNQWLVDFQTSFSVTWRKARTYPESGRYNAYRVRAAYRDNVRCCVICLIAVQGEYTQVIMNHKQTY